ncbi:MAG: 2-dehydropantoate 2-reductase [Clostridia bacterium]|nr:2-dehydropantoate 2-reductase [Clostridia bacterium]
MTANIAQGAAQNAVETKKIAIYGAGAMGTVLGALLVKGGLKNVDLINRNASHVENLRKNGARIACVADKREWTVPVRALLPQEMQDKYDVIFLMTKQRNNAEIVQFLKAHLQENGVICTTQNGLPEESVARIVGCERTYGAVTAYGAGFADADGVVELTSKIKAMSITVGGYKNDGSHLQTLNEILSYAAKETHENLVTITENLEGARWSKLSINAAFSGLSVVTGLTFGQIARRGKTRKLALGIIRECIAVALGSGVMLEKMHGHDLVKMLGEKTPIKRFIAYMVLPFAMRKYKKSRSGMLLDIQKGRKCEVDFINGAVSEKGKAVGVETPLCDKVVEITRGIENGLYETAYENVDFFEI